MEWPTALLLRAALALVIRVIGGKALASTVPVMGQRISLCVCVCVSTAPGVCVLGWVKCREQHFTAGYTLYYYVCKKKKKKKKKNDIFFFPKPIMVKCLNIGKNIGKPIYRSISKK